MSDDGAPFEYTLTVQRGDGTDDRDTHRLKVSARSIDELEDKIERARELLESKAADIRDIQPTEDLRNRTAGDQATLGEGGA